MSLAYPGGLITKSPTVPTTTGAPGIWTLDQALQYIKAGTWPTRSDPYFENVTLLLPGTGTNGAQNNTFLDSSTNAFSITRNGNTTQGTFSPFSQTGWSNYFDGTGDYLQTPSTAELDFETGDFTIEFWMYPTVTQVAYAGIMVQSTDSDPSWFIQYDVNGTNLRLTTWNNNILVSASTIPINTWTHIAMVRSGSSTNNVKLYINGVLDYQNTWTTDLGRTDSLIIGGGYSGGGRPKFQGYLSNIRIVKGRAVYTSAFTPPTAPLGTTTGGSSPPQGSETKLLTCQSNRFIDNSSNAFTLTVNGNPSVQAFSPFAPTAAYSAVTNGGSGYFDGTGDYLQTPSNSAFTLGSSGNFTVECWAYLNGNQSGSYAVLMTTFADFSNSYTNRWAFTVDGVSLRWYDSSGNVGISTNLKVYEWTHIAAVRNGSTITLYVNGTSVGTQTSNQNYIDIGSVKIGYVASAAYFNGYISDARVVKGTAVYTSNFTPPTAPLTAITNTSLLTNFTNAGITDATAKNDLETVGNAQISNTTAKFGSTSMYFDGTGDYLSTPNNPAFNCGTGDFTIEAWIYPTASGFVVVGQFGTLTTGVGSWILYINTSNYVEFYYDGQSYSSDLIASTVPLNSWSHLAITRYGSTVTGYLNGSLLGSFTYAGRFGGYAWPLEVGATTRSGGNIFSTGYIQDLRITKGIARYTQNFVPPSGPFQLL